MTAINRRISTRAEVEALATEAEGETVDYKGDADPKEWWELAKDVAAFANHLGGVILVGAFERPDGLPNLGGVTPERVTELSQAYYMAARDRCRPSPLVTCDPIEWTNGKAMLAVNVQAYGGGLVGAQFYALNRNAKPEPANAWQFPMRVGKDNPPLPLEQAIMHMSTHARRIAILLSAIGDKPVRLATQKPNELSVPWRAALLGFDLVRNVASFHLDGWDDPPKHDVPLDDVEAVWSAADGTSWSVRVSGFFEEISMGPMRKVGVYFSRPRGAA